MFGSRNDPRPTGAALAVALAIVPLSAGFAQVSAPLTLQPISAWGYADIADLFAAAPIVVRARIASATRIKDATPVAGRARFYVEADVTTLIRGAGGLPPRISYLVDVLPDSRGKLPKLKKADVLIAALPVKGRPGEIQLAAGDAQLLWSSALEDRVRVVITAAIAPAAPPVITGVGSAFHVAGSIPGEGETQIFLTTPTKAPVSLSVLRRPGEAPRWSVALGEIVDEASGPPTRDTLGWYRLACGLPRDLPDRAVSELAPTNAAAAREDYAFVLSELGPCARARR